MLVAWLGAQTHIHTTTSHHSLFDPPRVWRARRRSTDTRQAWWFEVVELLRKLILCGVTGFIDPGSLSQIVFCLVFSTLYMARGPLLSCSLRPCAWSSCFAGQTHRPCTYSRPSHATPGPGVIRVAFPGVIGQPVFDALPDPAVLRAAGLPHLALRQGNGRSRQHAGAMFRPVVTLSCPMLSILPGLCIFHFVRQP